MVRGPNGVAGLQEHPTIARTAGQPLPLRAPTCPAAPREGVPRTHLVAHVTVWL